MTDKEYRESEGISRSQLFLMSKSPMHFKYAMENPEKETAALTFGRAAHCALLEPERFESAYIVLTEGLDRRTKVGKAEIERLKSEKPDAEILTYQDAQTIADMVAAVKADPLATQLLTGEHEKPFFWTDPKTLEACKCRVDCIGAEYNGKAYITDYKTTDSCADGRFEVSCRKYGYKFQAGMYVEGVYQNTLNDYGFAFIAQEKNPPYAVRVYICSEEFIYQGYDEFRRLIGLYKQCKESGVWYGYGGRESAPVDLLAEAN